MCHNIRNCRVSLEVAKVLEMGSTRVWVRVQGGLGGRSPPPRSEKEDGVSVFSFLV